MPFRLISKIAATFGILLATAVSIIQAEPFKADIAFGGNVTAVQYYPQPGYGSGSYGDYRPQPVDPKHICIQKAGDIFRIPSKSIRALDVREVDRGVFQVVVSGRGRTASCVVDRRGNVLSFQ